MQTEQIPSDQRVLDLIVPAFGPTGEQILSVRYLISFDSIDRRLVEMRAQFLKIGFCLYRCNTPCCNGGSTNLPSSFELAASARAIGQGEFATRTTIERNDEIGALARAFNDMAESLYVSREALTEKIALYTTNEALKQVQSQLIRSERLAAIGQLAAGVSMRLIIRLALSSAMQSC